MSARKLLVVYSATGQQGGSVIKSVLADPILRKKYSIRGTTRDPHKASAQELVKQGIEVVRTDITDPESLINAFQGADIVYGWTVTVYDGRTREHEIQDGRALADAVVAARVPYYIYSTLPNGEKHSNGKLKNMGHFDGKEEVEQYIRTLPVQSAFVSPGSFMDNFHTNMAPQPIGDGTYGLFNFVSPETQVPLLNTAGDIGKWVVSILAEPERYESRVLCCATALYSMQDIVDALSDATGEKVIYQQIPLDVWRTFLPESMRDYIVDMFLNMQDYGYYGEDTPGKIKWSVEQVHGKLTTLEEYLRTNPLTLSKP